MSQPTPEMKCNGCGGRFSAGLVVEHVHTVGVYEYGAYGGDTAHLCCVCFCRLTGRKYLRKCNGFGKCYEPEMPISLRIKMRHFIDSGQVTFHATGEATATQQFEDELKRIIDEETAKVRAERDESLRQLQTVQARTKDLEMQLEARPKPSAQFWVVLHDESTGKEQSLGPFDFLEAPAEVTDTYCAISGKYGLTEKELVAVHRPPYSEGLGSRKRTWVNGNGHAEFTHVRITTTKPEDQK